MDLLLYSIYFVFLKIFIKKKKKVRRTSEGNWEAVASEKENCDVSEAKQKSISRRRLGQNKRRIYKWLSGLGVEGSGSESLNGSGVKREKRREISISKNTQLFQIILL